MHHTYPVEFLQQLNTGGLPPALLCLKVGSPVILLRNLDPGEGLCNGTRIVVLDVRRKVPQCRIISKGRRFRGKVVLIPRIRLLPNAETLPVPLKREQLINFRDSTSAAPLFPLSTANANVEQPTKEPQIIGGDNLKTETIIHYPNSEQKNCLNAISFCLACCLTISLPNHMNSFET